MSRRGQPHNFRSLDGSNAEPQERNAELAGGAEDLLNLACELQAQEQRFLRRLRQGPVPPEAILHLADAQAALRAAQRSFERCGNTSLFVLDPE